MSKTIKDKWGDSLRISAANGDFGQESMVFISDANLMEPKDDRRPSDPLPLPAVNWGFSRKKFLRAVAKELEVEIYEPGEFVDRGAGMFGPGYYDSDGNRI